MPALAIPDVKPGEHIIEVTFQEALRRALCAPGRKTRCWRQNAGAVTLRDRRGKEAGIFRGAVTGAADLSGIVAPSGRRLEVEVKVDAPHTDEQVAFGELIKRMGGIYLCVRYHHELSLAANVSLAVAIVDAATVDHT